MRITYCNFTPRRVNDANFESDEKHLLYKEYLRIIKKFSPPIFVMENVKGILSSKHQGAGIFSRIIDDLSRPRTDLDYKIRAFTKGVGGKLIPSDYVIRSELFGVPQARHRVILLGVRRDLSLLLLEFTSIGNPGREEQMAA
jgi:DNA (cytosine-5)-methyltransferase 1